MEDKQLYYAVIEQVKANNLTIVKNSSTLTQLVTYERAIEDACETVEQEIDFSNSTDELNQRLNSLVEHYSHEYYDPDGVGTGTIRDVINALN